MTWLLKLYPRRWRQRYGREVADLMAAQPISIATVVDVIAGAIDAWIYPQSSTVPTAADSKGERTMVLTGLKLRCAGAGSPVTPGDARKAAAVTLGGTLLLTLLWLWGQQWYPDNAYLDAMVLMAFMPPYLISLRFTSLKGRPGSVQAVFIVGQLLSVTAIMLGAAWLGTRI